MMQRMEKYTLERAEIVKNESLENVKKWQPVQEIQAAISTSTGATQEINQLLRIDSTHTAVTTGDVRVGDRFGGYSVDYVFPGRKYNTLYLKREEAAR